MIFQAWKMVFLNSMTFHDQGAPCSLLLLMMTDRPDTTVGFSNFSALVQGSSDSVASGFKAA